jgi:phosphoglycolate phosphatase
LTPQFRGQNVQFSSSSNGPVKASKFTCLELFFVTFGNSCAKIGEMMNDLKNYEHIIWDWNGTLLNDAWLCVDVMNGMLAERGLPLRTLEEYREMFCFPVRDYYVMLGYDFSQEPFDEVGLEFILRYNRRQHEAFLHPEVKLVLEWISKKGYQQYILSAREQNELVSETKLLDVHTYFKKVRGLDDHYAHGKTDVGVQLVKEVGAEPSSMLFIGDTLHDAEVANEIGVDCILIPNGHYSETRLLASGVPLLPSLIHLIELL